MQLAKYKKILAEELSTAIEEIEHLKSLEENKEHTQNLESALDEDFESGEEGIVADSQTEFWKDRKKKIETALEKIDKKQDYGICEKCSEKIAEARLEALPYAQHCIKCQNQLDNAELE